MSKCRKQTAPRSPATCDIRSPLAHPIYKYELLEAIISEGLLLLKLNHFYTLFSYNSIQFYSTSSMN